MDKKTVWPSALPVADDMPTRPPRNLLPFLVWMVLSGNADAPSTLEPAPNVTECPINDVSPFVLSMYQVVVYGGLQTIIARRMLGK